MIWLNAYMKLIQSKFVGLLIVPAAKTEFPCSMSISTPSNPYVFIIVAIEVIKALRFASSFNEMLALAPPTLIRTFLPWLCSVCIWEMNVACDTPSGVKVMFISEGETGSAKATQTTSYLEST